MMSSRLVLEDARVRFVDTNLVMVHAPSVIFEPGINYITGRNGSGKSTLLRGLLGNDPNIRYEGSAIFEGRPLTPGLVGMVAQDPSSSICRALTFRDNLCLACVRANDWLSLRPLGSKGRAAEVDKTLDEMGLRETVTDLLHRTAGSLSGGEQQLLAISMRVCRGRRILLLDECTASLDEVNTATVMKVLSQLGRVGCIALMVTHDLELIDEYKAPVYRIRSHQLAAEPPVHS